MMIHTTNFEVQDTSFEEVGRFLIAVESHGSEVLNTVGHGAQSREQSLSLEAKLLSSVLITLQA